MNDKRATIGSDAKPASLRKCGPDFRWEGVDRLAYKEGDSAPFKAVSRQILFSDPALLGELRYFEIEPGGYSTLERHEHMHAVVIIRGEGRCLVGECANEVKPYDLVTIPPWTWHQFRAGRTTHLGFLCLVNAARDRPQLPSLADYMELRAKPALSSFFEDFEGAAAFDALE